MKKNSIKLLMILALFLVNITCVKADNRVKELNTTEKAELEKIDKLYGGFTTIKSRFIQKDNLGNQASGWFVIEKPGKARIEYNDIPVRFITVNNTLMFQDTKMKQKSFLSIKSSPFAHLLEKNVSFFDDKIIINNFVSQEDYVEITISSKEYPEVGTLTLFLTKDSADIIKWNVEDAKGIITEIFLVEPSFSKDKIKNQSIFNTQRIKVVKYEDIK